MCDKYSKRQICLMNHTRKLWSQHVYWTRFFIISTAADLGDLEQVTNRLLQNPKDFARMLAPICGSKAADQFEKLFTEHLTIAAELVNAAKNKQQSAADDARRRWYKNADEIAGFLSSVNSCWCEQKWKSMMHSHLEMTEKEAGLRLSGNYAADIKMFGKIEDEALEMADYMAHGLVSKC